MLYVMISYILKRAVRDKIAIAFFLSIVCAISLSVFFGSAAITEQDQFSVVFISSALRLISVFIVLLFCTQYIRNSFESFEVEYLLTRPLSRLTFLMAHAIAFLIIACAIGVAVTVLLSVLPFKTEFVLRWGGELILELIVISQASLFFSMVISSQVAATLATTGLYVLSRLIGEVLAIIDQSATGGIVLLLEKVMVVISFFVPRLDLLAQSNALLYGEYPDQLGYIIGQVCVLIFVILTASYIDLKRKQF